MRRATCGTSLDDGKLLTLATPRMRFPRSKQRQEDMSSNRSEAGLAKRIIYLPYLPVGCAGRPQGTAVALPSSSDAAGAPAPRDTDKLGCPAVVCTKTSGILSPSSCAYKKECAEMYRKYKEGGAGKEAGTLDSYTVRIGPAVR